MRRPNVVFSWPETAVWKPSFLGCPRDNRPVFSDGPETVWNTLSLDDPRDSRSMSSDGLETLWNPLSLGLLWSETVWKPLFLGCPRDNRPVFSDGPKIVWNRSSKLGRPSRRPSVVFWWQLRLSGTLCPWSTLEAADQCLPMAWRLFGTARLSLGDTRDGQTLSTCDVLRVPRCRCRSYNSRLRSSTAQRAFKAERVPGTADRWSSMSLCHWLAGWPVSSIRGWSSMSGHDGRHAGPWLCVLTAVEGRVAKTSACHGAACSCKTPRARHGHDEEAELVTASASRSFTATRLTAVLTPAKRHGHQVQSSCNVQ